MCLVFVLFEIVVVVVAAVAPFAQLDRVMCVFNDVGVVFVARGKRQHVRSCPNRLTCGLKCVAIDVMDLSEFVYVCLNFGDKNGIGLRGIHPYLWCSVCLKFHFRFRRWEQST